MVVSEVGVFRMNSICVLCFGLSACFAQVRSELVGGTINGWLYGEDGSAIEGAAVSARLLPPYRLSRSESAFKSTVSMKGGAFAFAALREGVYQICVQAPRTAWLNPCEWGAALPTFTVSAGQPNVTATVQLKKGVVLPLHLDDPSGLLAAYEGKRPGAHVLLGVTTDAGTFHPAALVVKDAAGRKHQVAVPAAALVKLVVASSFFRLSDPSGAVLANTSVQIPTTVQLGMAPSPIVLRVIGTK